MTNNIKKARENAGLSQKQVALTLHVSAPTVSDWESGKISPSVVNLKALSDLYRVPTDYLLGRSMLSAYLIHRQGGASDEDFSQQLGIDIYLLRGIEHGFGSSKHRGQSQHQECLGEDDIKMIADFLGVDSNYIACLADNVNPHLVNDVEIPADDLTSWIPTKDDSEKSKKYSILSPVMSLFGSDNAAALPRDALEVMRAYMALPTSAEKDMLRRSLGLSPLATAKASS